MGLRSKILLLFLISAVISVFSCLLLLGAAFLLYRRGIAKSLFSYMYRHVGIQPVMIILGILLFLLIFLLLSKRTIKYIEEISESVREISQGNLDTRIVVKTTDELGKLAFNINTMTEKLNSSMKDERNAERTKNELVTSVSHDLRTPLTSILGYLGLIVNNKYRDEGELKHYAGIAFKKTEKLNKLIDELFDFTRISYGGMKLKTSKINLGSLLEQLNEEFFPIFKAADMESRLSIPKEKVCITADGDMLARVFENLITNAVRYGSEGKYIDIELSITLNNAIIRVTNYGTPISQKDIPYIFDRFYRAEKSRSQQTGGTGLGLAIAKNIVELHGGDIYASAGDNLTTFEVKLSL